jgi:hypothetical protein
MQHGVHRQSVHGGQREGRCRQRAVEAAERTRTRRGGARVPVPGPTPADAMPRRRQAPFVVASPVSFGVPPSPSVLTSLSILARPLLRRGRAQPAEAGSENAEPADINANAEVKNVDGDFKHLTRCVLSCIYA